MENGFSPFADQDAKYLQRCRQLALLGAGHVAPNPMVGAVLVADDRVIGEGWHRKYREAHAEVNAVASVRPADHHLICRATLYVSLEPCCIVGNTPACTDLIIRERIPRVVVGSLDYTPGVDGSGVQHLRDAGVEVSVRTDVYSPTDNPAAVRNVCMAKHRPYIILKYARSQDGFMGLPGRQEWLSHPLTRRLVHKWRSEVSAILVGSGTALIDDPALTNRLYFGSSPVRIVLDRRKRLHEKLQLMKQPPETWVVRGSARDEGENNDMSPRILSFGDGLNEFVRTLFARGISSLLVEGGAEVLSSFLEAGLWDEVRLLTTERRLHGGIPAPEPRGEVVREMYFGSDRVMILSPLLSGGNC